MDAQDAEEFTQALGQIVGGSWRQIHWAKKQGIPEALGLTVEQWVHDRLGGYVRLTIEDRRQAVAELSAQGESTRAIAAVLGCVHRTVQRDLSGANAPAELTEPPDDDVASGANAPPESLQPPDDDVASGANASAGSTCPPVTDEDAETNVADDPSSPSVTDVNGGKNEADHPRSILDVWREEENERVRRVALAHCLENVRLLPKSLSNESHIKYVATFFNNYPDEFESITRMTPVQFFEILRGLLPKLDALEQQMKEERQ